MANGNELTLVGNITSDPELQIVPSGAAVTRFGLAWNRRFQQDGEWQEEPHFFDVTVWRELAENVADSFKKGDRVVIVGRLEHSRWEDKKTGENRSKVGVVADEVAASVRWATVEVTKVGRDSEPERGGSRGRGDSDRGSSRGKSAPARGGRDRYPDDEPF